MSTGRRVRMAIYNYVTKDAKLCALSEAYFGKTPTLLEIEKQIGIIRQNALKRFSDINRSEEVLKLNRLFEKQFGMDCFSLHIDKNDVINAYTVPIGMRFDIALNDNIAKKVEATKEGGYRFKPNNGLCIICNVYYGLIKQESITDAEILAIILHELGHNFADAFNKQIEVMNRNTASLIYYSIIYNAVIGTLLSFVIGGIIIIPTAISRIRDNSNSVIIEKEKKTRKRYIVSFFDGVQSHFQDMGDFVSEVTNRLFGKWKLKLYKRVYELTKQDKYVKKDPNRFNEVIADKFAGVYGYGPEQASALMKMEKIPTKAEKFVEWLPGGDLTNQKFNEIVKDFYRFDCHPHIIQRINEEIKLLNYELDKSDLDPKLVRAMREQVKELERLKNESMKVCKEAEHNEKVRAEFYRFVNTKDPDAVSKKIEDEINKAFDEYVKK